MRGLTLLLAPVAFALAAPAPPPEAQTLKEMQAAFSKTENCRLPEPGENCAGASRKDIIMQYGKNFSAEQKALFLNAAKMSGGQIVYEWPNFGFSGFVPEQVVSLLDAHAPTVEAKLWHNACFEIPWCGEAPC
ncbi:hypothetical protein BS50DRAFT_631431 [Corynespora cassiicola Philippines]|uniref:Inhibitor I9 domain-containing protein n=1 Tax=Corynespora cassiicola Philippines TaxID=1448308 RepID=A0A2T2P1E8_CORCC|nr:hypothetical protein BS50DRAFT_631431 [Corynespora cassiicola Philippines]